MADAQLKAVITAEDRASKVIAGVGSSLEKTQSKLQSILPSFKTLAVAGAAVGGALALLGGKALSSAADFEQAQISFSTMLGSADKANQLLKDLAEFGKKTPFELPGLIDASKKLIAFGTAQKDLIPVLRQLGDIAAGVGIPVNELAELYGKAQVQGRLFAEDVNQLTGRGIPVIQEFAKQFGVTQSEVKELVETGKIGFPEMQKAFASLTGEGSKFGGLMDAQSASLTGMVSNFKDGIDEMMRKLGVALLPYAKQVFEELNGIIGQVPAFVENAISSIQITLQEAKQMWQELTQGIQDFINKTLELEGARMMIDQLKTSFDAIWSALKFNLYPILQELWNNIANSLYPAIQELWAALQPLAPYFEMWAKIIGTIFIGALIGLVQMLEFIIVKTIKVMAVFLQLTAWLVTSGSHVVKGFADDVNGIARAFMSVVEWIQKAINKAVEFASKLSVAGIAKSTIGNVAGGFGINLFRAGGGAVNPNGSFIVGERGPELFTPSSYGNITPNNKLGIGGGINIVIYGDVSGQEIVDKVKRSLMNEIKQNAFV